jgi:sugar lactone lactonase YvrE
LHPYKILVTQELYPTDWGKRKDCCNAILTVVPFNGIAWSSNEAHFHISGTVNKQNVRYWAAENRLKIHQ